MQLVGMRMALGLFKRWYTCDFEAKPCCVEDGLLLMKDRRIVFDYAQVLRYF